LVLQKRRHGAELGDDRNLPTLIGHLFGHRDAGEIAIIVNHQNAIANLFPRHHLLRRAELRRRSVGAGNGAKPNRPQPSWRGTQPARPAGAIRRCCNAALEKNRLGVVLGPI
jgi:hypothetical protein